MSVQALSFVIENSKARLGDRLALMSIANHANRYGCDAFPSLATIAKEAHISHRQARRAIRNLEVLGELEVRENAGPNGTHLFRITGMAQADILTPDNLSPPGQMQQAGGTNTTESRSDLSPEPSFNRPEPKEGPPADAGARARSRDEIFDAVLEACAWSIDALTDDARGRVNKSVKQLRELKATPDQLRGFREWWRRTYGTDIPITPQTITGNWAQFMATHQPKRTNGAGESPEDRERHELQQAISNAQSTLRLLGDPEHLQPPVDATRRDLWAWTERVAAAWDEHTTGRAATG